MDSSSLRRRTNGTIDIDHYRNKAIAERRAMMTRSLRRVIGGPLMALSMMPARNLAASSAPGHATAGPHMALARH